jgi:hypothetical protein
MNLDESLKPSTALLVKLGSIAVHVEEFLDDGHEFDLAALKTLRNDPEVLAWMAVMGRNAFLPVKRKP